MLVTRNAIALNSSMVNMARLIGPSVAGILIAAAGEGYCFLIDGISYLAVIASLLLVTAMPSSRAVKNTLRELREGWHYVSRFAPIRSILLLLALISLMGMPYTVLMPIFAALVLHGGAHTLGFLMGASGVGALAAAFPPGSAQVSSRTRKADGNFCGVFGGGLIAFSRSGVTWLSMGLMFFVGFGMMQQMASSNTILQTIVDEDKRGRVMSYYAMAFTGMAPFGSLLAGTMANRIGAPDTLLVSGICCVLGAAWFGTRLKFIRPAVRPIYVGLGIIPELAVRIQEASALRTPPQE